MKKFIPVLVLSGFLVSCHFGERIRGNGTIKTEIRSAGTFNAVDVSGNFEVYIKQDSVRSVKLEADENLMEYIRVSVDGETLVIETKDDVDLKGTKGIKVYVSSPSFKQLQASGSCNIASENKITGQEPLRISLTGASDVDMDLAFPKVKADLSGAGSIKLRGQTKDFSVEGSGSVSVKCMELMAENVSIEISGAGSASVFASVKLDVRVSGAGDVKYKGNATVTQNISGAGSVTKAE